MRAGGTQRRFLDEYWGDGLSLSSSLMLWVCLAGPGEMFSLAADSQKLTLFDFANLSRPRKVFAKSKEPSMS